MQLTLMNLLAILIHVVEPHVGLAVLYLEMSNGKRCCRINEVRARKMRRANIA